MQNTAVPEHYWVGVKSMDSDPVSGLESWPCNLLQVISAIYASVDWVGVYNEHVKLQYQVLCVSYIISTNSLLIPEATKPKLSILNLVCVKHYMGFDIFIFKVLFTQTQKVTDLITRSMKDVGVDVQ